MSCDAVAAPLVHPGRENWPCAPEPAPASLSPARQPLLASQAAPGPNSSVQLPACSMTSRKRPASSLEPSGGCKRPHTAPPPMLCRTEEKQRQERLQGLLDLFEGLPLPPSPVAVERRISIEHEVAAVAPAAGPAAAAATAAWVQPASSPTGSQADTGASRSPSPQQAEQQAQQADASSKLQLLACVASMQQGAACAQQGAAAAPPPPPAAAASPPASPPASSPPAAGPPATGSPRPPLPPQLRPQLRQLKRLLAMLGAVQAAAAQPEWRAAAARQPATAAVLNRLRQLSMSQQLPLCSVETLKGLLSQFCGCECD